MWKTAATLSNLITACQSAFRVVFNRTVSCLINWLIHLYTLLLVKLIVFVLFLILVLSIGILHVLLVLRGLMNSQEALSIRQRACRLDGDQTSATAVCSRGCLLKSDCIRSLLLVCPHSTTFSVCYTLFLSSSSFIRSASPLVSRCLRDMLRFQSWWVARELPCCSHFFSSYPAHKKTGLHWAHEK